MGEPSYGPRKADLRGSVRFPVEDAVPMMYVQGVLTKLGIGRKNRARNAVNLSEGGILLVATEKLPPGTQVKLRLDMEKFKDVIEANGVVRWCFPNARARNEFYVGVQFNDLPKATATKISKMGGYFTSPEYRQKNAIRKRSASSGRSSNADVEWKD